MIYISEFVLAFIAIGAIRIYAYIICIAYARDYHQKLLWLLFFCSKAALSYFSDDNFAPSKLYLL